MEIDYMAGLIVSCSFVIFVMKTITSFYLTAVVKRDRDINIRAVLEQKLIQKEVFPLFEDNRTFAVITKETKAGTLGGTRPEIISQCKPRFCANSMLFRHFKFSDEGKGKVLFYQGSKGVLPDNKGNQMAKKKEDKKEEWTKEEKERWYIRQEIQWNDKHAKALNFNNKQIYIRPICKSKHTPVTLEAPDKQQVYWQFADRTGWNNSSAYPGGRDWKELGYNDKRNIIIFRQSSQIAIHKSRHNIKKVYIGFVE